MLAIGRRVSAGTSAHASSMPSSHVKQNTAVGKHERTTRARDHGSVCLVAHAYGGHCTPRGRRNCLASEVSTPPRPSCGLGSRGAVGFWPAIAFVDKTTTTATPNTFTLQVKTTLAPYPLRRTIRLRTPPPLLPTHTRSRRSHATLSRRSIMTRQRNRTSHRALHH